MAEPSGKVAIVGTGLIGGSVGLALRRAWPQVEVQGYDAAPQQAQRALERGAVVAAAASPGAAARDCHTVVVAVPTDRIVATIEDLAPRLDADAVVTDVGSAKGEIVRAVSEVLGDRFVGGHPMAGSERAGIEAAREDLFQGASWILTPTRETPAPVYERLRALVVATGARPVALGAAEHDSLIARISHLPQVVATTLMNAAASGGDEEALLGLAAGGFRDVTRIAASDPDLWIAILRANRSAVLDALEGFEDRLGQVGGCLREGSWEGLRELFASARQARLELFEKPGHLGDPHTLAMLIPDRPGVLAEVTTAAGQLGANIEDLKIFHSPEGGTGRLQLIVDGARAATALAQRLETLGYVVDEDRDVL